MTEIPRIDAEYTIFPAWCPCISSDGKRLKPIIRCQCGTYCGIRLHHVHADGTVTASFLHGKAAFAYNGKLYSGDPQGCEWHVHLKLKDYDQGDFPSEP